MLPLEMRPLPYAAIESDTSMFPTRESVLDLAQPGRPPFAVRLPRLSIVTGFRLMVDGSATPHLVGLVARTSPPICDSAPALTVRRLGYGPWVLARPRSHRIRLTSR